MIKFPNEQTEIEIEEIVTDDEVHFSEHCPKLPSMSVDSEFPSRNIRASTPKLRAGEETSFVVQPSNDENKKTKKQKNEKLVTCRSEQRKDTYKQKIIDTIMARLYLLFYKSV